MIKNRYKVSQEVLKFPYNGNFEENGNEMFSEKLCVYTIKLRKRVIKRLKWGIPYKYNGGDKSNIFVEGIGE